MTTPKTIELSASNFTEVSGTWYSSPFIQGAADVLMTIAIWANGTGEASLQGSINEIDWVDLVDTTFDIDDAGLQTFTDCHLGLKYRIKTTIAPTKAQILI